MQNFLFLLDLLKEETLLVFVSFCALLWMGTVFLIIVLVVFWTSIFSFYNTFCVVASHCRPWMIFMANSHIIWHQAIYSLLSFLYSVYFNIQMREILKNSCFCSFLLLISEKAIVHHLLWTNLSHLGHCSLSRNWGVVSEPIFAWCKLSLGIWTLCGRDATSFKPVISAWSFSLLQILRKHNVPVCRQLPPKFNSEYDFPCAKLRTFNFVLFL